MPKQPRRRTNGRDNIDQSLSSSSASTIGAGSRSTNGRSNITSPSSSSHSNDTRRMMHRDDSSNNDEDESTDTSPLTKSLSTSSTVASLSMTSPKTPMVLHTYLHTPMGGDGIELTHVFQKGDTIGDANEEIASSIVGPSIRDDMPNMILLVILYMLQGVPLGLCLGSVPFLLQKSVSYTALGIFSLSAWPYSLKLLWSPIVDCWYSNRIGRRKSWIVPIQFIIGGMLITYSYYIEHWIASGSIETMTIAFFLLIMFVATQDIAVDGWAVTLLSKSNVGYASTCQSIGQNLGFFASYTIFLALSHPAFCNKFRFVPNDAEGFVTLSGFACFWGVAFILSTLYLLIMKHEPVYVPEDGEDMKLRSLYAKMWRIVQLKPVRDLIIVMVTCRVAFAAGDNITVLKLIEFGFPKENMAMMVVILFPFELLSPILIGRWSNYGNPLSPWLIGYPFRLLATLLGVALVYTFPIGIDGAAPDLDIWFYVRILVVQLIYSLASNLLFVTQCAFFAKVCDTSIGGSYMTLLNTIANLGSSWPKLLVFAAVDVFTCKNAKIVDIIKTVVDTTTTAASATLTTTNDVINGTTIVADAAGASMPIDIPAAASAPYCSHYLPLGTDGYYVVSTICFVIGIIWLAIFRRRTLKLGLTEKQHWSCN